MSRKTFGLLLAVALSSVVASAGEQEPAQDEGVVVRGAFVTTRPGAAKREERKETTAQPTPTPTTTKVAADPARGRRRGSRAKGKPAGASTNATVAEVKKTQSATAAAIAPTAEAKPVPAGIGIGYTLFLRGETGEAVRVSNKREFRSGESVRLLLETNTDGYLYIFNAENDGAPQMIFPNAKLNRGANLVRAHVPYEIPSSKEADERLRWFTFDERPAVERLYVVITRQPLAEVPTGEELVRLCADAGTETCAWTPAPEQWAGLKRANEREQVATSQARDDGRAETRAEREAATRGLGLTADAPLPSVIYMINSANVSILVATVDLIHR